MTHSVSHMHAVPPRDIAAAWNLAPADMHRRVDAAAAFNNNSSYSTAFLNSNGIFGKHPGSRADAPGPAGQLPQAGQLPGSQAPPAATQLSQSGLSAVHAAPFRPRSQQAPAGLVCPLTKVGDILLIHSIALLVNTESAASVWRGCGVLAKIIQRAGVLPPPCLVACQQVRPHTHCIWSISESVSSCLHRCSRNSHARTAYPWCGES